MKSGTTWHMASAVEPAYNEGLRESSMQQDPGAESLVRGFGQWRRAIEALEARAPPRVNCDCG